MAFAETQQVDVYLLCHQRMACCGFTQRSTESTPFEQELPRRASLQLLINLMRI